MKKNKQNPPHEKPISISLEFEDALKQILSVTPPQPTKEKLKKENGGDKNDNR